MPSVGDLKSKETIRNRVSLSHWELRSYLRPLAVATLLSAAVTSVYLISTRDAIAAPIRIQAAPASDIHIDRTAIVTTEAVFPHSPLLEPPHLTGNRVVVSLADKKALVFTSNGTLLREYSVYIGTKSEPTPTGQFRIMENVQPAQEEWYLGPRWIGFARGYDKAHSLYAGFHGWVYTQDDDLVEKSDPGWKTSTEGCVQLTNKDLQEFARLVGVGDLVMIVDESVPVRYTNLNMDRGPSSLLQVVNRLLPWLVPVANDGTAVTLASFS
jgi:lipoprotein-anchoring transpeptidase ErfK/SrfK